MRLHDLPMFFLLASAIILARCSLALASPGETDSVSAETLPSPALSNPTADFSCVPTNTLAQEAVVEWVVDGDTIHVSINGVSYRVRYIGINTPEKDEPGGEEASLFNLGLVGGQTVRLIKDVSDTDKYGRLLRYVFVGDTFVNYELVSNGLAVAGVWEPDSSCGDFLMSAEMSARSERLGLWE